MPLLTLSTNQPVADKGNLCTALSKLTSEILGKPESYVMVLVQDEQSMSFAGSSEPTALLQLKSLGLPEDKTAHFSKLLCHTISESTGIASNRIYIEFSNPARHMWGWDKHTFG